MSQGFANQPRTNFSRESLVIPRSFRQTSAQIYKKNHGKEPATWHEANAHTHGRCPECTRDMAAQR